MAFSRKAVKSIIGDREDAAEIVDQIIDAHVATVAPIKAELNRLEEENGGKTVEEMHAEVERMTAEVDRLKAGEVDENGKTWKARYEEEKARFDAFKEKAEAKNAYDEKAKAFRSMLIQEGVTSHVDLLVRANSDIINSMELQDGKVKNHESVSAAIRSECRDFIGPGQPVQPNATTYPTRTSIMNIVDRSERLAAIKANPELFR